jgi:transcriptional regulator with XRE-family HTH domain
VHDRGTCCFLWARQVAALDGDIDRAYLGHIERATKNATLPTIWKMAKALGVQPSTIFVRAERLLEEQIGDARST